MKTLIRGERDRLPREKSRRCPTALERDLADPAVMTVALKRKRLENAGLRDERRTREQVSQQDALGILRLST